MPLPSPTCPRRKSALSSPTCSAGRRRASRANEAAARPTIRGLRSRRSRPPLRGEPLPLSPGQETLWFLDQLEPGNTTYNCPAVVRVTGPLDPEIVRRAFEAIVHRHESLRSTFHARGDARVVEVLPPAPLPMEVIDLCDLPPDDREARARRLSDREGRKPFDLARGPMLRLAVIRLGPQDHFRPDDGPPHRLRRLVDRRPGPRVHDALPGDRRRPTAEFPPLPIQYPDFAYWQRRWLADGRLDGQLDLLEEATSRHPAAAGPADRSAPAASLDVPRGGGAAERSRRRSSPGCGRSASAKARRCS